VSDEQGLSEKIASLVGKMEALVAKHDADNSVLVGKIDANREVILERLTSITAAAEASRRDVIQRVEGIAAEQAEHGKRLVALEDGHSRMRGMLLILGPVFTVALGLIAHYISR
jgi:hypothetical protein